MLRFRINPLRFFGRRTKSTFDISRVMEPLKKQSDVYHLKIDELNLKISDRDSILKRMTVEEQHKFIIDLLPEDLRNNVIVELSALPEESIDCEVRKVYLSKVPILPDSNIPATPQSFLDTALYHLSKSSGALSTDCLWLCGDLALKNFCISNGFNPKIDNSKTRIVNFLMKSFDESHPDLQLFWLVLNDCQRNAYEDYHELDVIRKHMKYVESFCNALFDIHVGNQFICEQFKKSLPESMKTKDNIFFDFY